VVVTDTSNRTTAQSQVIEVIPNVSVSYPSVTYAIVNKPMASIGPTLINAEGQVTYTLSGTLPHGLNFTSNGRITGTPAELGRFEDLTIEVTDSIGDTFTSDPF